MTAAPNRVLVTGATGFIGRHVAALLSGLGVELNVLCRATTDSPFTDSENISVMHGDVCNQDELGTALQGCKVVINLAGVAHVDSSDRESLRRVNQGAPGMLFRAAERRGLQRLVHVSSSLAAEAESGRDDSAYARSKLAGEQELRNAAKNSQLEFTIIRPANVYGPGMRGNLATMIRLMHRGRMPRLPRMSASLSMVAVNDLAKAIWLAAERPEAAAKTYTVTDGVKYSLSQLEAAIYQECGRKLPAWPMPSVVLYAALSGASLLTKMGLIDSSLSTRTYRNLVTDRIYSNVALCEELGFSPMTDFYRELPRILQFMEQQGPSKPT